MRGNAYKGKDHAEKAAGNEKEIPCTLVKDLAADKRTTSFEGKPFKRKSGLSDVQGGTKVGAAWPNLPTSTVSSQLLRSMHHGAQLSKSLASCSIRRGRCSGRGLILKMLLNAMVVTIATAKMKASYRYSCCTAAPVRLTRILKHAPEKGFAVIAIRGVDPFACSEVLRSIKVPAAFGARFAWTLSGVPFILHLLRECPDNEWVFVAEDSCWLYQQSDSASLLAIKDTAATDFPEGVFQRSVCGYQLACRRIPRNKKIRCPIDLSTGKATLQEDVKFFHPIGSKLFLVQKGWLRLVQKVSLEHDREGYWDWIMSLMRTVGALRLHQPFVAGSAEHFSLVDGGRVQAAELPNASDQDA